MGIQSICKVKAKVTAPKPDGTTDPEVIVPYFFRGSNVYKNSQAVSLATFVEHIPQDKWSGKLPLTPVGDLIRCGVLARLSVRVKPTVGKPKTYSLIVDAEQLAYIFDGSGTANMLGQDYILTKKDGSADNKGKIIRIGTRTEAYNP